MTDSLIQKLKAIQIYADTCAEGPSDPEFTQFCTIAADLNAIILQHEAEQEVLRVRGSYDAPGFDACVKAELAQREISLEKCAIAVSDFHTRNSFKTSTEEWKQCCRNEAKTILDAAGVKYVD